MEKSDFLTNYMIYLIKNLNKKGITLHKITRDILIELLVDYDKNNKKVKTILSNLAKYEILLRYTKNNPNKYVITYLPNSKDEKLVDLQKGGNIKEIDYNEIADFVKNNKNILINLPKYDKYILDQLNSLPPSLSNINKLIEILK